MTSAPPLDPTEQQQAVPDEALLRDVAQRQPDALMALYARYGAAVYGMALRVTRQTGAAEEVTQDIFFKVWQQPDRWNPALGRFISWLLASTRNASIDRLRRERRSGQAEQAPLELVADTLGDDSPFDDPLWADGQELRRLLNAMPAEQRQLIELAFYKGYTHSELAELLRLPLGTVKTRLRAAIHRLRALWMGDA